MPKFNRERRVIELLASGSAVLLFRSWDTPGVLAATKAFTDALEHPAGMNWDKCALNSHKDQMWSNSKVEDAG